MTAPDILLETCRMALSLRAFLPDASVRAASHVRTCAGKMALEFPSNNRKDSADPSVQRADALAPNHLLDPLFPHQDMRALFPLVLHAESLLRTAPICRVAGSVLARQLLQGSSTTPPLVVM
jgi:hypothetical protein